jgi:hypothetical protein
MAGHVLLLAALYSLFYTVGLLDYAPGSTSLIRFDAGWFQSISINGYFANEGQSNIPFFPLFPYLWRLLGVNDFVISLINLGILLLGAAWLGSTFALRRSHILLLLSVPPIFFCFVPYAEALFFLFGVVLLRGLHRQHLPLTLLGLFGCCLSRSAATLFVPAFAVAEIAVCTSKADIPQLAKRLSAGLLIIAMALGVVMFLHYQATGDAFAFFEAHKHWGHEPQWRLPSRLHSTGGLPILWLDSLAFLTGLVSFLVGLGIAIRWIINWFSKDKQLVPPSRAVVFSLGYCIAAIGFILVYQNNSSGKEVDIVGSSRYILATPFFGVLLAQIRHWPSLPLRKRWFLVCGLAMLCLAMALWLGWPFRFPGFMPSEASWLFALWVAYVAAYVIVIPGTWRYSREANTLLYTLNLVYQVFLLNLFLGEVWIG